MINALADDLGARGLECAPRKKPRRNFRLQGKSIHVPQWRPAQFGFPAPEEDLAVLCGNWELRELNLRSTTGVSTPQIGNGALQKLAESFE